MDEARTAGSDVQPAQAKQAGADDSEGRPDAAGVREPGFTETEWSHGGAAQSAVASVAPNPELAGADERRDENAEATAPAESRPVEPTEPRASSNGRAWLWGALTVALVLAAVGGGYALGRESGADLSRARAEGVAAGQAAGNERGTIEGREVGLKTGRTAGFRQTYRASYRRAYRSALKKAEAGG